MGNAEDSDELALQAVIDRLGGDLDTDGDGEVDEDAQAIGRYRVIEEIGRGGMGRILKVRDRKLRRTLAMKIVLGSGGDEASSTPVDENRLSRFLEEAQVTGQLDHPGVPPVHELGLDPDGRLFFTMRLVKGRTLAEIFQLVHDGDDVWSLTRAIGVMQKVCEAMAFAHDKHVIHRDLKPANVMVGRFGETYVMDWGLAKLLGVKETKDIRIRTLPSNASLLTTARHDDSDRAPDSPLVTMDGDVVGTPVYMSPEQAKGQLEALGPRSDVYSVGAMLYHLLTGRMPYIEPDAKVSPPIVLKWVMEGPPTPAKELAKHVPDELIAICEKAMARDLNERYAGMLEVSEDLQAFIEHRVVRAYRTGAVIEFRKWVERNKATAAAIAVALVAVVGGLAWNGHVQRLGKEELAQTNEALALAKTEAEANEVLALANATEARWLSYASSISAANASLALGAASEARKKLDACAEQYRGWEWKHLRLRSSSSLREFVGHESFVFEVAYSPDGRFIASGGGNNAETGSDDFNVRLWNAETGELVHVLEGHEQNITSLSFSPSGTELASSDWNGEFRLWDVESGTLLTQLGRTGRSMTYLPDGIHVASGHMRPSGTNKELEVINVFTDKRVLALDYDHGTHAIVASPDGRRLAVGFSDSTVRVLDLDGWSGEVLLEMQGAPAPAGADQNVPDHIIEDLDFSPDGNRLLGCMRGGGLRVWDAKTGEPLLAFAGHDLEVRSTQYGPDGSWFVSASEDRTLRFWDALSGELLEVLHGHDDEVRAVAVSPAGDRIVSGSMDKTLRLWDGQPGSAETILRGEASNSFSHFTLAFSPDGTRIAWRPTPDQVHIVDARTGETLVALPEFSGFADWVRDYNPKRNQERVAAFAFDAGGEQLYSVTRSGSLQAWNAETGVLIETVGRLGDNVYRAYFSHDRRLVGTWSGSEDDATLHPLQVWSAATGELVLDLGTFATPEDEEVWILKFSEDGKTLVAGGIGETRTFDLETGRELFRSQAGGGRGIFGLAIDPKGKVFVEHEWGRRQKALRVWDLESGALLRTLEGHAASVSIDFSPDGSRLVSGNWDGTLSLWDLERGELVSLRGHNSTVATVAFSPDGSRIASHDTAGALRIWETASPEERSVVRRKAASRRRHSVHVRELVDELFEEHVLTETVVARLEADRSLDSSRLEAAIRLARARPVRLVDDVALKALNICSQEGLEREEYERALGWMEWVHHVAPYSETMRHVLGAAQFRLGRHREALESVKRGIQALEDNFPIAYLPECYALLALIQHSMGIEEARSNALSARNQLGQFTRHRNNEAWRESATALVEEAERALNL